MVPCNCPGCNTPWEEEQTIYEYFLEKYKDKDKAKEVALMYGCTEDLPKHFSKNVTGIEIQGGYDGVSYWKCGVCNKVFDRWTLNEVKDKEC